MTQPAKSLPEILKQMLREGRRRILALTAIFAFIALAALVVGVLRPKEYEAHAVILVESKNIIANLMEGRAVATGVTDQASIVSQAMQSRRILRELLVFGGWGEQKDPRVEQRMLAKLSSRIRISKQRPELVKLSYVDTDPQRCFAIAKKLGEIYVRESLFGKARQSSSAFGFIDRQVNEYGAKMAAEHAKVQEYFRSQRAPRGRGAARGKSASRASASPGARASAPRLAAGELAALRAEESVLAGQVASVEQGEVRRRRAERIDQLQREFDTLLQTYTDKHPMVERVRDELLAAKDEAEKATAAEERATTAARARLTDVRASIASATDAPDQEPVAQQPSITLRPQSSTSGAPQVLALMPQASPAELLAAQDSTLADLLRRYESTRDVYQDLLKRRENARVSMELDAEHQGLTMRVYEEPELPRLPTGMRLMHVTVIGLMLGAMAPLGLLFGLVRLDPRVRSAEEIERVARAPLLVTIPCAPTAQDRARERRLLVLALAIVGGVVATYAVFLIVRLGAPS